jgi:hypothetical protein
VAQSIHPLWLSLYRGVTSPIPLEGLTRFIRTNRRPRFTMANPEFNVTFNLLMEHCFDTVRLRQKALFVSGNIRSAARYARRPTGEHVGRVTMLGGFRHIHSAAVQDSADIAGMMSTAYRGCFTIKQWQRHRNWLIDPMLSLRSLLYKLSAVLPPADFAVASDNIRAMLNRLGSGVADGGLGYSSDDLAGAARTGAEIIIFDSPAGYRLDRLDADEIQMLN